ncbi:Uma2 family endonuclease [Amycolatopsis plumensis]|uniref:Uma2 family endonuclease n=1 Tax=Amycolatopsis plumensis TaxID=236508 RepID=A0ABV5U8L3_9PSEU
MPEDQTSLQRVELVDGMLLVSPWPGPEHQRLLGKLQSAFASALPGGTELLPGVNVRIGTQRLLIPDLVILNCPGIDTVAYAASDVLLAAEIVSPSTKIQDRVLKRAVYAEALIPYHLLVEPGEPIAATLFELHDGEYQPIAKSGETDIELTRPFTATIRLT